MVRKLIFILESNHEIAKIYAEILGDWFDTRCFGSIASLGSAMNDYAGSQQWPDLLVTELNLPDGTLDGQGRTLLSPFFDQVPVLIVTGKDDLEAIHATLRDFADDYLTKPVNNNEFLAKCRHLTSGRGLYECDALGMTISRNGAASEELTSNEFRLMTLLSRSGDYAVPVQEAARSIWGQKVSDQRIHTMLSRLRPKIRSLNIQLEMTKDDAIVLHDLLKEV